MIRKLSLAILAAAALSGCVTSGYGYRGGSGDYYHGSASSYGYGYGAPYGSVGYGHPGGVYGSVGYGFGHYRGPYRHGYGHPFAYRPGFYGHYPYGFYPRPVVVVRPPAQPPVPPPTQAPPPDWRALSKGGRMPQTGGQAVRSVRPAIQSPQTYSAPAPSTMAAQPRAVPRVDPGMGRAQRGRTSSRVTETQEP